MKKKFLAILLAATAVGANAESLFWDSSDVDKTVTLGARLGWNFASVAGYGHDLYDGRKGLALGAAVDINLIKSFSINTGLYFTMKGCSMDYETTLDDISGVKGTDTWAVNFLELPIYASYHLRFSPESDFQIFVGPYFGVGVYGKRGTKLRNANDAFSESKVSLFSDNGYHRWQTGIGLGASYTYGDHYVVGMQYQWGVSDVGELIDRQWNLFQLSIGYNF